MCVCVCIRTYYCFIVTFPSIYLPCCSAEIEMMMLYLLVSFAWGKIRVVFPVFSFFSYIEICFFFFNLIIIMCMNNKCWNPELKMGHSCSIRSIVANMHTLFYQMDGWRDGRMDGLAGVPWGKLKFHVLQDNSWPTLQCFKSQEKSDLWMIIYLRSPPGSHPLFKGRKTAVRTEVWKFKTIFICLMAKRADSLLLICV